MKSTYFIDKKDLKGTCYQEFQQEEYVALKGKIWLKESLYKRT